MEVIFDCVRRSAKTLILFSVFYLLFYSFSYATHNRAGEISYTHVSGFTYTMTIHTYTKASSVAADRDSLEISWGDGTKDTLPRTNGGGHGVSLGNDIKYNEYTGTHTYPGLGTYVVSMSDPNRISDIKNINNGNSVNEPFYIEDSLKILPPSFLGYNNSPVLLNPPIDFGNANQVYIHNPNAYDPDGDSLSFEFIVPRKAPDVNVANYVDPNQIPGTPPGNTFTIDHFTGQVTWASPTDIFCPSASTYNFAILIREYRNGTCIGTMVRDMEVIVNCISNNPPVVAAIHDTCVVAGTQLKLRVSASDPDVNQTVTLTSNGGPYDVVSAPATFIDTPGVHAHGTFTWNTNCDHVRSQFYQVIFRAQDNYSTPLVDLENWLITVVAPPPQNVLATAIGNDISVTWSNPYTCGSTARFIGFSVWRREGSNPFAIDTCDVGLAGKGYVKLAEHLADYQYLDQTTEIGKEYCYRVLAEFADKTFSQYVLIYYNNVYSLPSNEACAQLAKVLPVITNVSVTSTSTSSGTMYVAWSKPDHTIFDSIQHPGPYKYVILRSQGFPGGTMQRIDSISAATFTLLTDTIYNDNGLNTQDSPYSYKIGFYSNEVLVGETKVASSIYLTTVGSDHIITLTWDEVVPWDNGFYVVYRKNGAGLFDSVGVSTSGSYVDGGLQNLVQQCYKVKSVGGYSAPGFINPIVNFSEEQCAVPIDSVGPCPPTLDVHNICNTPDFALTGFVNELIWSYSDKSCAEDVLEYLILYSPGTDIGFSVIDTVTDLASNTFTHFLQDGVKGCYAVEAVDSNLNLGALSNDVCVENCPVYVLPNVFTPNGDGHNDTYHPFLPINIFISSVNMKIFDQWGDLVFATTDRMIGWDGKNQKSGKDSPEAVYYYVCDVYSGGQKVGETLSGYIHLFR